MGAQVPQILPLPVEVAAQLKSSTAIPSLNSVVVGLAENALDASARKIEVIVDFRRGSCSVEDDGCGILPIEFSETGGLGKPYCMSYPPICPELLVSDFSQTHQRMIIWLQCMAGMEPSYLHLPRYLS
jgi:hypothetical protein